MGSTKGRPRLKWKHSSKRNWVAYLAFVREWLKRLPDMTRDDSERRVVFWKWVLRRYKWFWQDGNKIDWGRAGDELDRKLKEMLGEGAIDDLTKGKGPE